jgi:hypothetical protein
MKGLPPCPKCRGLLYVDKDFYGIYVTCFSCGWCKDVGTGPAVPKPASGRPVDAEQLALQDGCVVSASCLQCPLPECTYEQGMKPETYLRDRKLVAAVKQRRSQGKSTVVAVEEVAFDHKVTERTIYRAIRRGQRTKYG